MKLQSKIKIFYLIRTLTKSWPFFYPGFYAFLPAIFFSFNIKGVGGEGNDASTRFYQNVSFPYIRSPAIAGANKSLLIIANFHIDTELTDLALNLYISLCQGQLFLFQVAAEAGA